MRPAKAADKEHAQKVPHGMESCQICFLSETADSDTRVHSVCFIQKYKNIAMGQQDHLADHIRDLQATQRLDSDRQRCGIQKRFHYQGNSKGFEDNAYCQEKAADIKRNWNRWEKKQQIPRLRGDSQGHNYEEHAEKTNHGQQPPFGVAASILASFTAAREKIRAQNAQIILVSAATRKQ